MNRAIGIYRVSERGDRDELHSPDVQINGMKTQCKRDGMKLLDTLDEVDVSGKLPLEKRRGLWPAVQAIEADKADVLLVHQFDRLVRNLTVQREIVDRVEKAGGTVLTGDFGEVSHKTAIKRLTSGFLGLVHEYYAEVIGEKAGEAQARAIANGTYLGTDRQMPPGYRRGPDRKLAPVSEKATNIVKEAFAIRLRGAAVREVRAYLGEQGWTLSHSAVDRMLANRHYLGEVRFGELVNEKAHVPLVDRDVFDAVQKLRVPAGRHAKSERLLARLGVLRCGTCGGRMSVSHRTGEYGPQYRCGRTADDCGRHAYIAADAIERIAREAAERFSNDTRGHASAAAEYNEAKANEAQTAGLLKEFAAKFAGLEEVVEEEFEALKAEHTHWKERRKDLMPLGTSESANVADDWDDMTLAERRIAVRTNIASLTVAPGRGAGRVTVKPLRKLATSYVV
jgi:DNA invertase Pin-like site-specific DNA recombinase